MKVDTAGRCINSLYYLWRIPWGILKSYIILNALCFLRTKLCNIWRKNKDLVSFIWVLAAADIWFAWEGPQVLLHGKQIPSFLFFINAIIWLQYFHQQNRKRRWVKHVRKPCILEIMVYLAQLDDSEGPDD